jgi:hypothetical protein
MNTTRFLNFSLPWIFCLQFLSITLKAQEDLKIVVPGIEYNKGFVHHIFFGFHHRKTWSAPVRVPVLDLGKAGLKPLKKGGSRETSNLRMTDREGREWVIRSVNKDLANAIPEQYQNPLLIRISRDMASANHPYAPLVVSELATAAGIVHSSPRLFVLPDDESLGEYRQEFGGMLVMLEERPDESWKDSPLFLGSDKVVGTEAILEKINKKKEVCFDEDAYLQGRMLDLLIGDWSRHDDQYRWLELPDQARENCDKFYVPVPRDRDHAFYRNDGLINRTVALFFPKFYTFSSNMGNIRGLLSVGLSLDTIVLKNTGREQFIQAAKELRGNITDEVITRALSALPDYDTREKEIRRWETALQSRRDQLEEAAATFYEYLRANLDR